MKSLNPRITRLRELMELEERRAGLQEELDQMVNQMSKLKDSLFADAPAVPGEESSAKRQASVPSQSAAQPRRGRRGRTPRGQLKAQILSALTAAGPAGVRVVNLAKDLGINPVNVHSWFHSAIRRFPEIKKIDRGQYRLQGSISGSAAKKDAGEASSAGNGRRGRPRATAARTKTHTRRGELSERILSELTSAGAKGANVRDLADKIGAPYK